MSTTPPPESLPTTVPAASKNYFDFLARQVSPGEVGELMAYVLSLSHRLILRRCQFSAENPVAALTIHRIVIHYRDCASLTLGRGSQGHLLYTDY